MFIIAVNRNLIDIVKYIHSLNEFNIKIIDIYKLMINRENTRVFKYLIYKKEVNPEIYRLIYTDYCRNIYPNSGNNLYQIIYKI